MLGVENAVAGIEILFLFAFVPYHMLHQFDALVFCVLRELSEERVVCEPGVNSLPRRTGLARRHHHALPATQGLNDLPLHLDRLFIARKARRLHRYHLVFTHESIQAHSKDDGLVALVELLEVGNLVGVLAGQTDAVPGVIFTALAGQNLVRQNPFMFLIAP